MTHRMVQHPAPVRPKLDALVEQARRDRESYRASIDNALRDARRQRNAALRKVLLPAYLVLAVMVAAMVVVVAIGGVR
jgi:t-SNARE complex subunit (syntaxin)